MIPNIMTAYFVFHIFHLSRNYNLVHVIEFFTKVCHFKISSLINHFNL